MDDRGVRRQRRGSPCSVASSAGWNDIPWSKVTRASHAGSGPTYDSRRQVTSIRGDAWCRAFSQRKSRSDSTSGAWSSSATGARSLPLSPLNSSTSFTVFGLT